MGQKNYDPNLINFSIKRADPMDRGPFNSSSRSEFKNYERRIDTGVSFCALIFNFMHLA